MTPAVGVDQAPIPPPSYHRDRATALRVDALTLVRRLQLLALCRVAVHLAHEQCPPPLPAGLGGAPRIYSEESLLLLALLRTLWRLSSQELHDWLSAWPALALACELPLDAAGGPRMPSKAQQSKRLRAAGAPPSEMLFVLLVRAGVWMGLTRGRDLIIDSAPSWPGAAPIPMRPLAMPPPTIPVHCCWAIGCTRCSVAGRACRCSSASPPPRSTMYPSPVRCWKWQYACLPCARA